MSMFVLCVSPLLIGQENTTGNPWMFPLMLMGIFAFMYMLMMRPQKKRDMSRRMMLENLKKNDKIITIGGMVGVVSTVNKDKNMVTLRLDEGVHVDFSLQAIAKKLDDEATDES
jgi:preprotein translocase YajC subunit